MGERDGINLYPEGEGPKKTRPVESSADFVGRLAWGFVLGSTLAVAAFILSLLLVHLYVPDNLYVPGKGGSMEMGFARFGWMYLMGKGTLALSFCHGFVMAFTANGKNFGKAFRMWVVGLIGIHVLGAGLVWWQVLTSR